MLVFIVTKFTESFSTGMTESDTVRDGTSNAFITQISVVFSLLAII